MKQIMSVMILSIFCLSPLAQAQSHINDIQINQLKALLKQSEQLVGVNEEGELCRVSVDESISITREDNTGLSIAADDYTFDLRRSKRALHLFAPTCDGHSELHVSENFTTRKLVVQLIEEFRGIESEEICILNTKR
jgi:hypothetical protein